MTSEANEIVVVDGETRLLLEKQNKEDGTVVYAEEYYRWRTGNSYPFPASLNANEIAEQYKLVRK